ncbi:MAG: hypothetical protein WBL74_01010 [Novosphingobium sp.]|uniref:hypothetical protein n=1 Tax=Novosphingobium sp. TaxID=1874826 RepID=UPI003C7D38D6
MNRIVLAILALFAGLAAQVAPAEARLCGQTEINATLGIRASARVVAVAAAAPFRAQPRPQVAAPRPSLDALPLAAFAAPTVRLGSDRARE